VGYEKFDLLWRGQKIAGAAQRRNKLGLLIQGSVQPPALGLAKMDWQSGMCAVATERWQTHWLELELDHALRDRIVELEARKYARSDYTERR